MLKPMNISDLKECWPRLRQRFPYIAEKDARNGFETPDHFLKCVADKQHITISEAREEVADFLYVESLHAELDYS